MAKISLCMIVGNVAEYIERCLRSFAPIADEICLVRAIGNQTPDATMSIAATVCEQLGIPLKREEYHNKPAHADWPHVDDFAAARQLSFDLATHEYCFWCDSDDVLESGAELVRELAARAEYAAYVFPYKIFARGLSVSRARMMLKSSGVWKYAVHEDFCFHVSPVSGIEEPRVVVNHLPDFETKTGSHERNLRILRAIPPEDMTTGLLYHYHTELLVSGDTEASLEIAREALARPDIGRPEKYEMFMNFAQHTKDPNLKSAFLHQAYQTDPRRREALALLANEAMNYNARDLALAYAGQMIATPAPATVEWNSRAAVYGWVGDDIYAQALRMNGDIIGAEAVRQKSMKRSGAPRISLVHATRGRPEQAALTRKMWLDLAERPELVEHIFVFDSDDQESCSVLKRMHHLELPAGGGCVAAWNHGALATVGAVVVQLSDDFSPVAQWDRLILERLGIADDPARGMNERKVLAVSDGFRDDKLLCMAIVTRGYFLQDNFLFHPWFTGVYSDNWFTEIAYARNAVIEARDIVFKHQHPFATFGKNVMPGKAVELDETYVRQNSPERYAEGEAVIQRLRQFKDWSTVPGFFNYWNWYEHIARIMPDGAVLCEVGCWLGRSIIYLAQELQRLGKTKCRLIAVDHFRGESNQVEHEATVKEAGGSLKTKFIENITRCGVADMIEILEGDSICVSEKIPDFSVDFCYIDAAHDYESVRGDVMAYLRKLKPGGIISGHDAQWHEVKRAVTELFPEAKIMGNVWVK